MKAGRHIYIQKLRRTPVAMLVARALVVATVLLAQRAQGLLTQHQRHCRRRSITRRQGWPAQDQRQLVGPRFVLPEAAAVAAACYGFYCYSQSQQEQRRRAEVSATKTITIITTITTTITTKPSLNITTATKATHHNLSTITTSQSSFSHM